MTTVRNGRIPTCIVNSASVLREKQSAGCPWIVIGLFVHIQEQMAAVLIAEVSWLKAPHWPDCRSKFVECPHWPLKKLYAYVQLYWPPFYGSPVILLAPSCSMIQFLRPLLWHRVNFGSYKRNLSNVLRKFSSGGRHFNMFHLTQVYKWIQA